MSILAILFIVTVVVGAGLLCAGFVIEKRNSDNVSSSLCFGFGTAGIACAVLLGVAIVRDDSSNSAKEAVTSAGYVAVSQAEEAGDGWFVDIKPTTANNCSTSVYVEWANTYEYARSVFKKHTELSGDYVLVFENTSPPAGMNPATCR